MDQYFEEHPKIGPIFEVDIAKAWRSWEEDNDGLDHEAIQELRQAHEALEKEMVVSQHVHTSTLEEANLGTIKEP